MPRVSSQRFPWVGPAERAVGSGRAGLGPGGRLTGAGLRGSSRRRTKKPGEEEEVTRPHEGH